MRRDLLLEQILIKIRATARNGFREVFWDDLQNQYRDMEVMEGLNRQQRLDLIKSKGYKARKRLQREGYPVIRIWHGDPGIGNHVIGLQVCDGSLDATNRLKGDLDIDMAKRDGIILALDERTDVAQVAGVLTRGEIKRYQLIGGKGKKIKKIKK